MSVANLLHVSTNK